MDFYVNWSTNEESERFGDSVGFSFQARFVFAAVILFTVGDL